MCEKRADPLTPCLPDLPEGNEIKACKDNQNNCCIEQITINLQKGDNKNVDYKLNDSFEPKKDHLNHTIEEYAKTGLNTATVHPENTEYDFGYCKELNLKKVFY